MKELYKERTTEICTGVCWRLWLATYLCKHERKWSQAVERTIRKNQSENTSGSQKARNSLSSHQPNWRENSENKMKSSEGYCMSRHNIIKLLKTNDEKKILKSSRDIKHIVTYIESNKEKGDSRLSIRNYANQIY